MAAMEKFVRIFATTVPAFFAREKPISRKAKPACMNMTRQPATATQIELMPTESGIFGAAWNRSALATDGKASTATSPSMSPAANLLRVTACVLRVGRRDARSLRRRPPGRLWTTGQGSLGISLPAVDAPATGVNHPRGHFVHADNRGRQGRL